MHPRNFGSDRIVRQHPPLYVGGCEMFYQFNPRTYTQIHTPTVVQGRRGWMEPLHGVFDMLQYFETSYLQWKVFDLLNKRKYILGVVALLEACDVTNNGRHLGFFQQLEIRLKPQERVIFFVLYIKNNTKISTLHDLATRFTFIVERSSKNMYFHPKLV